MLVELNGRNFEGDEILKELLLSCSSAASLGTWTTVLKTCTSLHIMKKDFCTKVNVHFIPFLHEVVKVPSSA